MLGISAMTVGGHDAIEGTEINVRLVGALLLGAGLVLIAGAVGLRGGQPRGRALAMVAALLGVVLGVLTFLTQVANDEPDERLALWAVIIVFSALAAYHVRRQSPSEERRQGIWSQLPILKSAVSLGVLISVAQFWYTSIYLPTTAPASVTLEPKFDRVAESGDQIAVTGTVTIRSNSDARVNVLASALDLWGEQRDPTTPDREAWRDAIRRADATLGTEFAPRYEVSQHPTRVYHQRLVPDGTYLDPGEVITVPVFTRIPKNRHNTLVLDAFLTIARGSVLAIETEQPEPRDIKDGVAVVTAVPEGGWLQDLTRGNRFVRVEYKSNPNTPEYPWVQFTPNRRPNPPTDFDERLKRFYGVVGANSQAIVPLPHE